MNTLTSFDLINTFWEIAVALLLGVAIGVERSVARKTAGMRTYGLVAMGACLFVIIARLIAPVTDPGSPGLMYALQGLIMGIGFIGGGVIFHAQSEQQGRTSGITTAAGLWITSGVGAAVGFGLTTLAIYVTFVTLFAFTVLWILEQYVLGAKDKIQMLEKHMDE